MEKLQSHLTVVEKQKIVQLHVRGFKNSFISKQMKCHRNTISSIIGQWRRGEFVTAKKLRKGRYSLTAQKTYQVLKYFVDHPFNTYKQCIQDLKLLVSCKTIAKVLTRNGIKNYIACTKPFLSMQNRIKRLRFAIKYIDWTWQWANVVYMDEKTIQTYANGRVMVKRRLNERYDPGKIVSPEVQNTKNKVNLFGMISSDGPNMIFSVPTKLNGKHFKQLMSTKVKKLLGNKNILMDNAAIHIEGLKYLRKFGLIIIDFPPKSGDLNPIENVWGELQKKMNKKLRNICISTQAGLLELIRESWKEIPASFIQKCLLSMPQRLRDVIAIKGGQTRF